MNPNHILSLLQNDYTTISVVFTEGTTSKEYIYKVLRADNPQVDDIFIVNTKYTACGYAFVSVVTVHDEPEINTNASYDYSWVVQKVDRARYDAVFEIERKFAKQYRQIQQKNIRQQAAQQLLGEFPEGSDARKELEALLNVVSNPLAQLGESKDGANESGNAE